MGCEDKVTIEVLGQKELSRIAKDEIDVPLALSTFRDNVKPYSALSDGKRRTDSLSLLLIVTLHRCKMSRMSPFSDLKILISMKNS